MEWLRNGVPWAGLAFGAMAWAISTQLNYALVGNGQLPGRSVPWIALALALVALAGGALSWRAWRSHGELLGDHAGGKPRRFVAGMGVFASVLFATAIALQGVAGLVVR